MRPVRERPGTGCTERDRTQDANHTDGLDTPAWNTGILGSAAGGLWLGPLVPILLAMVSLFSAAADRHCGAERGRTRRSAGLLYSWAGVALGRHHHVLVLAAAHQALFLEGSQLPKLEKAQQWVNRFDTSSLFMLSLLPFTPTSFMHFAFGMSDFDEKRYLRTVLLGKGLMVAIMAVFGQSLVSSLKNPFYLVLSVLLWGGMYWVSKKFCRKHHLE